MAGTGWQPAEMAGICFAHYVFSTEEEIMQTVSAGALKTIVYRKKSFSAATCNSCGAKMYPKSLLKPHLNRHQRTQRWFMAELSKLQHTFSRIRDIA